jgi:hypothetical protein
VVWLAAWTARSVLRLCHGEIYSVYFVIFGQFIFFGIPLALDHITAPPLLTQWPGYAAAVQDPLSCFIFDVYMAFCPVLLWHFGRPKGKYIRSGSLEWSVHERHKPLLIGTLLLPAVAMLFAPNRAIYSTYASSLTGSFTKSETEFHTLLGHLILLSVFAAGGLMICAKNAGVMLAALSPSLLGGIWVNGKRSIVIITVLVIGTAVFPRLRRHLGTSLLTFCTVLFGICFFAYSYAYQAQFRPRDTLDFSSSYENIRLDYGRDFLTKMVIMHELNAPQISMLEYRGESFLFDAVMFVSRDWWPEKPWPYAVYATAAALRIKATFIGWSVTTSWLEECIANLGWVGMLVAPLSLAAVCRAGDRRGDPFLKVLTIAVTLLLLTVQIAAWFPLGFLWCAALWMRRRAEQSEHRTRLVWAHPRGAFRPAPRSL